PPSAKPRAPLSAKATAAPAREVLLAPDTETDLGSRWAWAVQGSARQAKGGMWIGYELSDVRAGGGHGLLSDSEGIDLALLNGHATRPQAGGVAGAAGLFPPGAAARGGGGLSLPRPALGRRRWWAHAVVRSRPAARRPALVLAREGRRCAKPGVARAARPARGG